MTTAQTITDAERHASPTALSGVLFFPVTPFDRADSVDTDTLQSLVAGGFADGAGAAFVACGTGEYHALSRDEYAEVVRAGAAAGRGLGAVFAGVGGPLGHARDCVRVAEDAGVSGFLVMPPYLVKGPQEGVVRYVEEIAARTSLPVIAYHRGAAQFSEAGVERLLALPNLSGIKDGVGDIALMQRFVLAARRLGRDDVQFFNGLLTAEASQAAYGAVGVPLYSSAVFAMAPRIATAFYTAYRANDYAEQARLLDGFYTPLVRLRDETPGFAVSLIKAGLRLRGFDVGSVRAPLTDPTTEQTERLRVILERGEALVR